MTGDKVRLQTVVNFGEGSFPRQKWRPKTVYFRSFIQVLRDLMANIFVTKRDIDN